MVAQAGRYDLLGCLLGGFCLCWKLGGVCFCCCTVCPPSSEGGGGVVGWRCSNTSLMTITAAKGVKCLNR